MFRVWICPSSEGAHPVPECRFSSAVAEEGLANGEPTSQFSKSDYPYLP